MALPYSNNWACKAISAMMRDENTDAHAVAAAVASQQEFVDAIQGVIDERNQPGYNPDQPDGDPAQHVVTALIGALETPGDYA